MNSTVLTVTADLHSLKSSERQFGAIVIRSSMARCRGAVRDAHRRTGRELWRSEAKLGYGRTGSRQLAPRLG